MNRPGAPRRWPGKALLALAMTVVALLAAHAWTSPAMLMGTQALSALCG